MTTSPLTVGVIGASGYAGSEFLRLAAAHPDLDVAWATGDSQAGVPISELYPGLAAVHPNDVFVKYEPGLLDGIDVALLALPHGASQPMVAELAAKSIAVIDLAADFRHDDPAIYEQWYGEAHTEPELLGSFVYHK